MRKLKLQMQMTVDGFVAGPNGEMDWMTLNWDDELKNYVTQLTAPVDCILLGRKLAEGFIEHWATVAANPDNPEFSAGKKFTDTPKIVFSRTLDKVRWENTTLVNKNFVEEINQLKEQPGEDIIVYGGATFVASLIEKGLIDEYHLFINPTSVGQGLPIFLQRTHLNLVNSKSFACGITVLQYAPVRN